MQQVVSHILVEYGAILELLYFFFFFFFFFFFHGTLQLFTACILVGLRTLNFFFIFFHSGYSLDVDITIQKKKIMMYFMPINLYLCIYIIFNACLFSLFFKKSFIYNYWCKPISIISGFSLVQQYFKKYIDKSVILLSNWFRFTLCFSFLGESEMDLLSDLPVKDPLSKPFDFGK